MQFTSIKQRGFTLVEVAIVAPILILVIMAFVAASLGMLNNALITSDRSKMTYDIQNTLSTIEQDIRLSTQFLDNSRALNQGQGRNQNFTGTEAFTSDKDLILNSLATLENPLNAERQLAYYANQPNICGDQKTNNRPFIYKNIYFIKDSALYKRTVLPDYNIETGDNIDENTLCDKPWQRNSCLNKNGSICQIQDMKLLDNVKNFKIEYFNSPDSTTPNESNDNKATNAVAVKIIITTEKTIAGETLTLNRSIRATKLNNIITELPIPEQPDFDVSPIYQSISSTSIPVEVSWDRVPNATSYTLAYKIANQPQIILPTLPGGTTSQTINIPLNQTYEISLIAKNSSGESPAKIKSLPALVRF